MSDDLFSTGELSVVKPVGDLKRSLRVIITVKAAPQPSAEYGETVCVAGLAIDPDMRGWVRLYPMNFRYLQQDAQFHKYDVVTVDAIPARQDARRESWRPQMNTLIVHKHLREWPARRTWLDSFMEDSMCALRNGAHSDPAARSLGLIRARQVTDLVLKPRPKWTVEEQRKIDRYVSQLDLFGNVDRTPLQAPRLAGWYRWTCRDPACRGHEQGILDWEFVAFQRRFPHLDDGALAGAVKAKFFNELCAPDREVSFYVGNQAKRYQTFSILGVFWPPRGR
jgi:hypothetical protein